MENNVSNICHPLAPVCTLLRVVEAHIYRRNFISPNLCPPLLPDSTEIRFIDAIPRNKQITADPTVSYTVGDMTIALTPHGGVNTTNPLTTIQGSIIFQVSTSSEALTQELGFELGSLCMAMRPVLIQANCAVKSCTISKTTLDDNSTFFLSTVVADITLSYQQWHVKELEGILREVRINTNLST